MRERSPHFLLFSDGSDDGPLGSRWRFVLQSIGGSEYLAAEDTEPGTQQSRLELLAVVRGLEALDQPSRVTLVTKSRYVRRGIRRGLSHWRARRWHWEHFGELVPIRDQDLWQRVDRALAFHEVSCSSWPSDRPESMGDGVGAGDFSHEMPEPDFDKWQEAACDEAENERLVPELAACNRVRERAEANVRKRRTTVPAAPAGAWSLSAAIAALRQNVLTPLSHVWRPPFTRAA